LEQGSVSQARPVGYLTLIKRNSNYRSLWVGEVISLFGDWFNLIASAALISNLTESGLAVGLLFVIRMLAPFLASPPAGIAADRFNRKRLLILSDISRAVVVIGFLFVRDAGDVWLLYSLTAIQMAISGIFYPARNAILPDIVNNDELGAANALSSATWSVMAALGAAVGGVVAGQWGIYPAFIIDAATFLLSALVISRITYHPPAKASIVGGSLQSAYTQYIEGISYLAKNKDVFIIATQKGAIALTVGGIMTIVQVALAEQVYVIGEGGGTSLGIFFTVLGIGTGVGPIFARRFTGDRERSLRIFLALAYAITILGLVISAPLVGFAIVLVGLFLRAVGVGINWVFSTQLLLQLVPNRILGRVFSTEFAIFTLASAMGTAIGGWIFDNTALGISGMLWFTAAITIIPALLWSAWTVIINRSTSTSMEGKTPASTTQPIEAGTITAKD
jgi:MFS family permease